MPLGKAIEAVGRALVNLPADFSFDAFTEMDSMHSSKTYTIRLHWRTRSSFLRKSSRRTRSWACGWAARMRSSVLPEVTRRQKRSAKRQRWCRRWQRRPSTFGIRDPHPHAAESVRKRA